MCAPQFRRESLPWIEDLVGPLLAGPPQPLTDTLPPERLADTDSRFVDVGSEFPLRLHYKLREPGLLEAGLEPLDGTDRGEGEGLTCLQLQPASHRRP